MKRYFILASMLFVAIFGQAQNVNFQEASLAATRFLKSQQKSMVQCAAVATDNEDTLFYIFNADNSFVVISGDKRVPPVLAFSDHQLYNTKDVIPPVQMWLDNYRQQLIQLKKTADGPQNPEWQRLNTKGSVFESVNEVAPLVKSHWGQGANYNYYCPRDAAGNNDRVVTGCVATAMGQLLYYFRFPKTGVGSYSYVDSTYGKQFADYGNTTYRYEEMCDDPTSINPAISELIYHCGVGVDMVYGPDGSGMYNHSAAKVLRTYFKFSPETDYLYRDSTTLNWDSVIVSHLQKRIPLYYAGWSDPNINGHGFICDGYKLVDSNYYYHFNFGWEGSQDGYFYTNAMNVSAYNFNLAQELIINAYPDTTKYNYPEMSDLQGSETLTSLAGSFTDGTHAMDSYRPNMDYTWNIQPDADNLQSISWNVTYDIAEGDTLYIVAGNDHWELTADSNVLNINSECKSLQVRFKTDDSLAMSGFHFNYNGVIPDFCKSYIAYSDVTKTITDGSDDANYNPLTTCKFRIMPSRCTAIILHIIKMDLEKDHDFLYVYDVATNDLLAAYTGHKEDTTIIFNLKRILLSFETDEANNADGFELEYQGSQVGVEDYTNGFAVYPNPASHSITVKNSTPMDQISIFDLLGREIYFENCNSTQQTIAVDHLPNGVYILNMRSGDQIITRKFVKER